MKKIIVLLSICFFAVVNFASMEEFISIQPSPRAINVETIKEISQMIKQMNEVLKRILNSIEDETITTEDSQRELYKIMVAMSENMYKLSTLMKEGNIDIYVKRELQSKIKSINKAADKIIRKGKKKKNKMKKKKKK